jgi:hypothetical protein
VVRPASVGPSAGDNQIADDVVAAAGHPGGVDHRVVLAQVRTRPVGVTVLPAVSTRTSLSSTTSALRAAA